MSIESQAEEIAKNAWLTGDLSRKINWQDEARLYVLTDEVVNLLTAKSYPSQPLHFVYLETRPGTPYRRVKLSFLFPGIHHNLSEPIMWETSAAVLDSADFNLVQTILGNISEAITKFVPIQGGR